MACLKLLKRIKKENSEVKIIVELHSGIPTHYLRDDIRKWDLYIKELLCHRFLNKYVDVMAVLSNELEVKKCYGIDILTINNGFDFSTINTRTANTKENEINLVAVSSMNYAHGYDRVIEGMHRYYENGGKRNILFRIVGEGEASPRCKKLIHNYDLVDRIDMLGYRTINELQSIYDNSDIGLSALALHRFKYQNLKNTVMKNKEYVAAGLPVVGCSPLDLAEVEELKKYVLEVPSTEEPIDMNTIISFYDSIYEYENDAEKVITDIRKAAEGSLTYSVTMKSVIDYVTCGGKLKS